MSSRVQSKCQFKSPIRLEGPQVRQWCVQVSIQAPSRVHQKSIKCPVQMSKVQFKDQSKCPMHLLQGSNGPCQCSSSRVQVDSSLQFKGQFNCPRWIQWSKDPVQWSRCPVQGPVPWTTPVDSPSVQFKGPLQCQFNGPLRLKCPRAQFKCSAQVPVQLYNPVQVQ